MKYSDTRLRLLGVEQILLNNPHGVSLKSILDILNYTFDIQADRKAIYGDLQALTRFYDLQVVKKFRGDVLYKMEVLNGRY